METIFQREDATAATLEQPDQILAQMKSTHNDIKALYNQGTPLYSKETIRKVAQELEICKTFTSGSRHVTLRGIDGNDYMKPFCHESDEATPGGELYSEGSTWIIQYKSIESLTWEKGFMFFDPRTAYLSMEIIAVIERQDPPEEGDMHVDSAEELLDAFHDIGEKWRASDYFQQLRATLAKVKPLCVLDKIFGVALGSPARGTEVGYDSILQHILLSTVHSHFIEQNVLSSSSKRYVQDPVYTQEQRDALSRAEYTVLEDPQAFFLIWTT